jgi:hypothetical protein
MWIIPLSGVDPLPVCSIGDRLNLDGGIDDLPHGPADLVGVAVSDDRVVAIEDVLVGDGSNAWRSVARRRFDGSRAIEVRRGLPPWEDGGGWGPRADLICVRRTKLSIGDVVRLVVSPDHGEAPIRAYGMVNPSRTLCGRT